MALTRIQSEYTYRSGAFGLYYFFVVGIDQAGAVSVRDIQTPQGGLTDAFTPIPQSVTDDIQTAIQQVENFVAQTSAVNGQLTFAGETSKTVTFATPFSGTGYRVVFSPVDFVLFRVTAKSTTGFTVQAGVTYSGTVGYDVFA